MSTSVHVTSAIHRPRPNHGPTMSLLLLTSEAGLIYSLTIITTTTLRPFNGLFSGTTRVSRYQKGKTSLNLDEARGDIYLFNKEPTNVCHIAHGYDGVWGCSGISWTICKQSAPRSRQITTPTPHQSMFMGQMLFLTPNQQCQSTEGKL